MKDFKNLETLLKFLGLELVAPDGLTSGNKNCWAHFRLFIHYRHEEFSVLAIVEDEVGDQGFRFTWESQEDFIDTFFKIARFTFINGFSDGFDNPFFGCKSWEEAMVRKDLLGQ